MSLYCKLADEQADRVERTPLSAKEDHTPPSPFN